MIKQIWFRWNCCCI